VIHREDIGSLAILRLDHGKVSALDIELLAAIASTLADVERSGARAVVLTGTGGSFSAGVDLWRLVDGGAAYVERFLPLLDAAFRALFLFPRPVVAAVNGHAIAGGCILACACDRSLMVADRGRIGVPELRVGVPFPALALEIVRFAAGNRTAQEAVFTGATWSPEEACRRRLVDEIVASDELLERARSIAEELARLPVDAYRLAKTQLRRPAVERADRLARETGSEVVAAWSSPHTHAAIRAYLERTVGKRSG
jgi:enoyl-CoA hydratase